MQIKAILFDIDGTLVDSNDMHVLAWEEAFRQTGVVFHMMSCITEEGRIGLTAVGNTPAEAEKTYRRAERVLLDEAGAALTDAPGLA